jgi:hypothetical protein
VQEAAERQREEVRQKLEAKLARGKPRIVSDCALQCVVLVMQYAWCVHFKSQQQDMDSFPASAVVLSCKHTSHNRGAQYVCQNMSLAPTAMPKHVLGTAPTANPQIY